jgi:hypothetical protein
LYKKPVVILADGGNTTGINLVTPINNPTAKQGVSHKNRFFHRLFFAEEEDVMWARVCCVLIDDEDEDDNDFNSANTSLAV